MHERSLVSALLIQVSDVLKRNGGDRVNDIRLEVGPLSGVEKSLIEIAFQELSTGTLAEGSALVIDEVPLTIHCLECGNESTLGSFDFQCEFCGSQRVQVTGGDALRLISVTIEEGEPE